MELRNHYKFHLLYISLIKIGHCYYPVVLLCNCASLSLNRILVLLPFLTNFPMISFKINQHFLLKIKLFLTVYRNKQILDSCQFRVRLKVTWGRHWINFKASSTAKRSVVQRVGIPELMVTNDPSVPSSLDYASLRLCRRRTSCPPFNAIYCTFSPS